MNKTKICILWLVLVALTEHARAAFQIPDPRLSEIRTEWEKLRKGDKHNEENIKKRQKLLEEMREIVEKSEKKIDEIEKNVEQDEKKRIDDHIKRMKNIEEKKHHD